jgi:hypothetical protein
LHDVELVRVEQVVGVPTQVVPDTAQPDAAQADVPYRLAMLAHVYP